MNLDEYKKDPKAKLISISLFLKELGITQYQSLGKGFLIIQNGELFQLIKEEEGNDEKKTSS